MNLDTNYPPANAHANAYTKAKKYCSTLSPKRVSNQLKMGFKSSFGKVAQQWLQFQDDWKTPRNIKKLRKEDAKELKFIDDFEYNEPVKKYRRDTPYYIQPPPERDLARRITLESLKKKIVPIWYYQPGAKYQLYCPQAETQHYLHPKYSRPK